MLEIKKGCWYACIKDIEYDDVANIMFSRGRLYWSPTDGYLPSNDGVLRHGLAEFTGEYFRPTEPEPQMTEFEAAFFDTLCEWQGMECELHCMMPIAVEDARELYAIAKRQMRKDYVVLDPDTFARVKQFNYDSGKADALKVENLKEAPLELATFVAEKLAEARKEGYEDALMQMPSWKKLSKTIRVEMDKYTLFRDAIMSPDGYCIELSELEKLPKGE